MLPRLFQKSSACGRFAREERGTQLVELAIVLPVLLVLFAGAAEFGRFFYTYQTLAKATRAGARYLTTEMPSESSDLAAARLVVYGNKEGTGDPVVEGLDVEDVHVERGGDNPALPDRVTVSIDGYTYAPIFDLGAFFPGDRRFSMNVALHPSTTMRMFTTIPS